MKTCIKCSKEINEEMMYCPYCGEKQDSDDFLSNLDSCLTDEIETKITLENEQEKFKLFDYEKVADDTYIIKGLKNKYVYKVDIPEGVVAICEEAFVNSKVIEVNLPNTLMEIEARAFKDCKLLKKINIPETLSVIGDEAFYNCVLLEVNFNKDNVNLGNDVFVGTISEKIKLEELERKEKEEYTETFIKKKLFGRYPQTKVTDICLINSLKNIFDRNEYGYIEYNHQEYHEYNADFYLVEPIKWKILEENNNMFCIMSEEILDRRLFYSSGTNRNINGKVIYPNNYEYSDLRAWLNGYDGSDYSVLNYANNGFIGIAFNKKEKEMIMESMIDNSAQSTRRLDNAYVCNDVKDKIYLMSYEEISKIYFDNDDQRKANATDFARAKVDNKYKSDLKYFWLRSPRYHDSTESYSECNRLVDICKTDGNLIFSNYCDSDDGIRPVLKLKIK